MDFGTDREQLSRDGSSPLVCVRRVTVVLAKIQLGKLAMLMDTHRYLLVDLAFVLYIVFFYIEQITE